MSLFTLVEEMLKPLGAEGSVRVEKPHGIAEGSFRSTIYNVAKYMGINVSVSKTNDLKLFEVKIRKTIEERLLETPNQKVKQRYKIIIYDLDVHILLSTILLVEKNVLERVMFYAWDEKDLNALIPSLEAMGFNNPFNGIKIVNTPDSVEIYSADQSALGIKEEQVIE